MSGTSTIALLCGAAMVSHRDTTPYTPAMEVSMTASLPVAAKVSGVVGVEM